MFYRNLIIYIKNLSINYIICMCKLSKKPAGSCIYLYRQLQVTGVFLKIPL